MCGAMDAFGERGRLLANIETILNFNREIGKLGNNSQQTSLFGGLDDAPKATLNLVGAEEIGKEEKLKWERDLLGLYVSGHPLDKYKDRFEKAKFTIKKIQQNGRSGATAVLGGIIEESKEIITKKNDRMAFVTISDFTGAVECVVFPGVYQTNRELFEKDTVIAIKAKVSDRGGDLSLIIEGVKALD